MYVYIYIFLYTYYSNTFRYSQSHIRHKYFHFSHFFPPLEIPPRTGARPHGSDRPSSLPRRQRHGWKMAVGNTCEQRVYIYIVGKTYTCILYMYYLIYNVIHCYIYILLNEYIYIYTYILLYYITYQKLVWYIILHIYMSGGQKYYSQWTWPKWVVPYQLWRFSHKIWTSLVHSLLLLEFSTNFVGYSYGKKTHWNIINFDERHEENHGKTGENIWKRGKKTSVLWYCMAMSLGKTSALEILNMLTAYW